MLAFISILKSIHDYLPKKYWGAAVVAALFYFGVMPVYSTWKAERVYHVWAADEHRYSDIDVDSNDAIRVYWTTFPLIPNTAFTEEWHLRLAGRGWIPIESWHYKENAVPPYRTYREQRDSKHVGFWGKWVDISGYDLTPGTYEIKVCYHYDDFNWGVNEWCANQEIIFTIEDDNEK